MSAGRRKMSACVAPKRMPHPVTVLASLVVSGLWPSVAMAAGLDALLESPVMALAALLVVLIAALVALAAAWYRGRCQQARLRELEAGHARYRAVFDALPEAASIKNARGQFRIGQSIKSPFWPVIATSRNPNPDDPVTSTPFAKRSLGP